MKKILTLIVLLSSFIQLHSQLENDKVLHFGAGAISGAAGAFVASELSNGDRCWTYIGAVGTSLLAGLAKESLDKKNNNTWNNDDLAATVLGGITVGVTIDLFRAKKQRKGKQKTKAP